MMKHEDDLNIMLTLFQVAIGGALVVLFLGMSLSGSIAMVNKAINGTSSDCKEITDDDR